MDEKQMKQAAKMIAIHGYRNSPIEDIHAGKWPKSNKLAYGKRMWAKPEEMIVTTKDGGDVIPWSEMSRITDEEMEHINKTVCNQIYTIIYLMNTTGLGAFFTAYGSNWDDPVLLKEWLPNKEK